MALFTIRTGATAHPEDSVMQDMTDLIREGGVKDLSSDDHLIVSEKSGTPDMSVDIATGRGWITGAGNAYPVRSTAVENVVVTPNASGNPRIDAVVIYADLAATPTSVGGDVLIAAVVAGTPAASPVKPTDSEIQTAVGASNPFERYSNVAVADSAAEILDANITDVRRQFKVRGSLKSGTTAFSATPEFDVSQDNYNAITVEGNVTAATVIGDTVDSMFTIKVIQAGSGGYTVAWWSGIDWFGGTPVLSTAVGAVDSIGFILKDDGRYDGYLLGNGGTIA